MVVRADDEYKHVHSTLHLCVSLRLAYVEVCR